jgi:alpha-glucosidase
VLFRSTAGADPGRDGCRVPLPWSGTEPPFGFSPAGATAEPWLPQPKEWRELTVSAESADGGSMLSLYREALRIRRSVPAFAAAPLSWRQAPHGVLAFDRAGGNDPGANGPSGNDPGANDPGANDPGVRDSRETPGPTVCCVANLSATPVGLPPHTSVLLASGPLDGGQLPPDTTAWLMT